MSEVSYTRPADHSSKFIRKLTEEALSTHIHADYHHIGIAVEVLSLIEFSNEQLALLILFLSQTTSTGQFALSFNHDIDLAISQNNINQLISLAETNQNEFFVELYDNPNLSPEDKNIIENTKNLEFHTILDLINIYNKQDYDKKIEEKSSDVPSSFLNLCPREDEGELCVMDGNVETCSKLVPTYNSCYKQICIESKKEFFLTPTNTSVVNVPSNNVQKYGEIEKREILCLPYIKFIELLTKNTHNFAKHLTPSLLKLYSRETIMYARYLRNKLDDFIF